MRSPEADTITVLPFDSALGAPDDLGRRMALNTQNILREESRLDAVRDPASGSYFVERLTYDLAAAAWGRFQRIEMAGGMANQMRSGAIARELGETLAERIQLPDLQVFVGLSDVRGRPSAKEASPLAFGKVINGKIAFSSTPIYSVDGDYFSIFQ